MSVETRKTICNRDCPDACGIVATVEKTEAGERVVKLAGDPDHPITDGFLCWRTNHFLNLQYGPERVTEPLLRGPDGELHPVSWDEALDFAARRLLQIRSESGPASILHYRSGGSFGMMKAVSDAFFRAFGPVTTKRGDICSGAGDAAQALDFGESESHDLHDLLNARHILVWGKNVVVSSPHTLPVLKQARARGTRLCLIDPVHHKTATLCERFIQPRPGGDFALAMAVARRLFERGAVTTQAAERCDNLDAFRAVAFGRTVDAWCADADVPVEAADDLASRLADGPTAILVGWGMGRRLNGASIVRALDALCAVSGNLGVPGGGVSFYYRRRRAFDTSLGDEREPPRTVLEPLLGQEILAAREPPVRAVWVTAGNPVVMLPDADTVARALGSRELLIVVDPFMTDTARLAHLVLPSRTLLEDDDLVGAYGHHYIAASRPVVAAPPGVRSDLEIIQGLAARVGLGDRFAGSHASWKERLISKEAAAAGVTLERLERGAFRSPLSATVLFADGKVPTPTGRVNLLAETPAEVPARPAAYPLALMSLSTDRAQSSQWSVAPSGPSECTVHPDTAAAAGLSDGDGARLESAVGSMEVTVRCDRRQRRDVALVPKGGHRSAGRCANALIAARLTDLGEGGALYDEGVRLSPR
ncbi:MAG TPA: molybdopterin-dependent oxidoreductase [Polyangia bacterium]